MAWASSKWGKFGFSSSIWPWRSRSIAPQNNRDLNQVVLHLLSKFGGSSLNAWWFMARTRSGLTDTHTDRHTHTDRQTQTTTIPEGQNWPQVKKLLRYETLKCLWKSYIDNYSHISQHDWHQAIIWMLAYWWWEPSVQISVKFASQLNNFHSKIRMWKYCLPNGGHFNMLVEVRQEYCRAHHLSGNYRTASDTWNPVSTNRNASPWRRLH